RFLQAGEADLALDPGQDGHRLLAEAVGGFLGGESCQRTAERNEQKDEGTAVHGCSPGGAISSRRYARPLPADTGGQASMRMHLPKMAPALTQPLIRPRLLPIWKRAP